MVADGRLSAVCAPISTGALADPTEENLQKLNETPPSQELPSDVLSPENCVYIPIEPSLVLKQLCLFNKGSAAGPTGIGPSYMRHSTLQCWCLFELLLERKVEFVQ